MRVVILSKALVAGAYQRKLEEIARLGVELTALVPHSWREPRVGVQRLERRFTQGYQLTALPIAFNGQHHIHFYPTLAQHLRRLRPQVLHIDEESFNLATVHALRIGLDLGVRCCFYNWANIDRGYPPPFSLFERYTLRHAHHAIAGNQEAATIIRRHGYQGPISVIPQFGVDPEMFAQVERQPVAQERFTIGYLGRLVPEKGVLDLVAALAELPAHIHLRLVGDGVLRTQIESRVAALGLGERVELRPAVRSTEVPAAMADLDLLVLPSHTTANWKEQFGRVLIEAMSCGVPVLGSSSAEIPNVVGAAGLIFPEGDLNALRDSILQIAGHPQLRHDLIQRGRARVLEHFTQAAVARRHVEVYREMLGNCSHLG
ncbi:glycosyl transferase group 1 [Oscillochloris trichoides DG-6]|uniref:Glycosyl transferase group 1 n=1 Tax=Oscillochloris trichoides DG-6 TaxID=765420 RepID=E1IIE7_9CHLR|nr:glycosyltransferase family 4 protein [Oscillochloris trichoides]EFO79022.1 glycosyl transferase group 1 [Oscillochloris trichoides DG-6]